MLVVDASVAVKWFVNELGSDAALRLLGGPAGLIAPCLVIAETARALQKAEAAGLTTSAAVDAGLRHAPSMFTELVPSQQLAAQAMDMARLLGHPVYDCFYLALAWRGDAMLITADYRFHTRASERGFLARLHRLDQAFPGHSLQS